VSETLITKKAKTKTKNLFFLFCFILFLIVLLQSSKKAYEQYKKYTLSNKIQAENNSSTKLY